MSRIYDALKKLDAERGGAPPPPRALDAIRLDQFLDLERNLLLGGGDADGGPDRLVHAVGTFLGVAGAGLGVIQNDAYRILATYGIGWEDRKQGGGASVQDPELRAALLAGRPVVLKRQDRGAAVRDVVVPFRGEVSGGLHLVMPEGRALKDEDLQLARALAGLLGIALAHARRRGSTP